MGKGGSKAGQEPSDKDSNKKKSTWGVIAIGGLVIGGLTLFLSSRSKEDKKD